MDSLPFSQACENNKGPILEHLGRLFADVSEVLEIGSGSGYQTAILAQLVGDVFAVERIKPLLDAS